MSRNCLLGLDLGTTTCRAMAFDERGRPLAEARTELLPECEAPGLAVIHAWCWWEAASQVLQDISAQLAAQDIRPLALGLAGLMHAVVPIDAEGGILAPSMLWMDQRCQSEVDWLNSDGLAALQAAAGPGARASTTPSLARLRWMAHHDPETVRRASRFLLAKDYVRYRLTGRIATDPSDAGGTMLYDGRSGAWSPGLIALAKIRPEQLPPILPSDSIAGYVAAEAATLTGLPPGLPVVAGMSDTSATRLGGVASGGLCALIYIGTAAWVHWPGPRNRVRMLATSTTGAALRWLRDLLGGPSGGLSYEELLEEAAQVPAGTEGLLFLPHLSGERGPFPDPHARGTYTGLSLRHGRGHLARALLEGTCCHLRWLMEEGEALGADEIWAAGGAAHSALWMQILADTLDAPVHTPEVVEAGALGAAILAAVGAGMYPDRERAAAEMVHPGILYRPKSVQSALYADVYARWRRAEDAWRARISPA